MDPRQTHFWRKRETHLVSTSCALSNAPCLRSSSIKLSVISFSLGVDSDVEIGGVMPGYGEVVLDPKCQEGGRNTERSTTYPFVGAIRERLLRCQRKAGRQNAEWQVSMAG